MKKELVLCVTNSRRIFASRQSNQTLLVPTARRMDRVTGVVLEDKYGNRYARREDLDRFSLGNHVFKIM